MTEPLDWDRAKDLERRLELCADGAPEHELLRSSDWIAVGLVTIALPIVLLVIGAMA
jgi:hypothetical protein